MPQKFGRKSWPFQILCPVSSLHFMFLSYDLRPHEAFGSETKHKQAVCLGPESADWALAGIVPSVRCAVMGLPAGQPRTLSCGGGSGGLHTRVSSERPAPQTRPAGTALCWCVAWLCPSSPCGVLSPPALQCARRTAFFLEVFSSIWMGISRKKVQHKLPEATTMGRESQASGHAHTTRASAWFPALSAMPGGLSHAHLHVVGCDHSPGVCEHCGCLFSKVLSGVRQ